MTDLSDWDFPIPDSLIALWLSVLESIIVIGMLTFVVALFERGGIVPPLPLPGGMTIFLGAMLLVTVVLTLFRLERFPGQ
ncbi:hypothetical protein ACFOZ7_15590 [Natribaculum luteum]|uniref:Cox cluster protein n=1 Tax=Natribaculum luteum TaxID=1586232 RepID=A0ABD5P2A5_9EURY|nr:hypothetical protein [Natribaculum luteum]